MHTRCEVQNLDISSKRERGKRIQKTYDKWPAFHDLCDLSALSRDNAPPRANDLRASVRQRQVEQK